jgi:retron-type reverse transcriptase
MGIPQGSPISALLSNIYMFSFDKHMKNYVDSIGGKYFRYCDDMLLIVPSEYRDTAYFGDCDRSFRLIPIT